MATHSSTLAWKIPWTEEPGRLQSMGSQRHTWLNFFTFEFIIIMYVWGVFFFFFLYYMCIWCMCLFSERKTRRKPHYELKIWNGFWCNTTAHRHAHNTDTELWLTVNNRPAENKQIIQRVYKNKNLLGKQWYLLGQPVLKCPSHRWELYRRVLTVRPAVLTSLSPSWGSAERGF